MKTPYIKINNKDWEYIEPILKDFGYNTKKVKNIDDGSYLILNDDGIIGNCLNVNENSLANINFLNIRYLVNDIEEFLEIAAHLTLKKYKKRMDKKSFKKEDLKPGMVVEFRNKQRMLVLPLVDNLRSKLKKIILINQYYNVSTDLFNEELYYNYLDNYKFNRKI